MRSWVATTKSEYSLQIRRLHMNKCVWTNTKDRRSSVQPVLFKHPDKELCVLEKLKYKCLTSAVQNSSHPKGAPKKHKSGTFLEDEGKLIYEFGGGGAGLSRICQILIMDSHLTGLLTCSWRKGTLHYQLSNKSTRQITKIQGQNITTYSC
jgi:hypothetical protein